MTGMTPSLGALTLVLVTLIWGTTFVIVKGAVETVPVPLFLALRFSAAALLLSWVRPTKRDLKPGLILGLFAFAGFATQTIGLSLTSASKAAFITGLSVILTPIASALWLRRRVPARAFVAATVALLGLALLTLSNIQGPNQGDAWVLATALSYAFFIVYLGEVAGQHSALALNVVQFWTVALCAWVWALPHVASLRTVPLSTWLATIYLAVMATVLAGLLQTRAQRVVPAHIAALIFVLEPVFAALFAYLTLGEVLGPWGWFGGGLVVVAMLISEWRFTLLRPRTRTAPYQTTGEGD